MKVFGMIGWSGSGKTTLIKGLIPELTGRGYSVSSMKHTHHDFDLDEPGKDSYEHRKAGAKQVLITGAKRWALLTENLSNPEPMINDLLERMHPVDLVIVEGFKAYSHPKMEIFRPSVGKRLLAENDPTIAAIATDGDHIKADVPILDLNNLQEITNFIIKYCKLAKREVNGST